MTPPAYVGGLLGDSSNASLVYRWVSAGADYLKKYLEILIKPVQCKNPLKPIL